MAVVVATTPSRPRGAAPGCWTALFRVWHNARVRPGYAEGHPFLGLANPNSSEVQSGRDGQAGLNCPGRTKQSPRARVYSGNAPKLLAPHPTHQRRAAAVRPAPFRFDTGQPQRTGSSEPYLRMRTTPRK